MLRKTFLHLDWEFRETCGDQPGPHVGTSRREWLPATVPGHVHLDLIANGVIQHPFIRMGELGCQWVDERDWSYRCAFEWSPDPELPRRVLRFEGLDTVCKVILNGEVVAEHDNMFIPIEVDVTDRLREGSNELRVDFGSPVRVGLERREAYLAKEGMPDDVERFDERAFVRKAQYMSGWDWGPRLVSCGIWRPVELIEYQARIKDVWIQQEHHSENEVTLRIRTEIEGEGEIVHRMYGYGTATGPDATIHLDHFFAWGPGDPSMVYALETALRSPSATPVEAIGDPTGQDIETNTLDYLETGFGICTVRLLREADEHGESFEFELNGRKIWARGANWIPDHSFPSTVTRAQYREKLEKALDMGFNMLRVWGGGLYETDEFYELCDEMGILVWQDFPFACSYYPDDEAMREAVRLEAEVNVKRLRNHPCLALWCGNNENHQMWHDKWGGIEKSPPRYYGLPLYEETLPAVVAEHDPGRSYIPSSAIGGENPNMGGVGDQHNWDVWHGRGDWRYYADSTARFSSEYGFASSCALSVWDDVLNDEDFDPRSPVVRWHDKTGKGTEIFIGFTKLHYPDPVTLEDWVYYSQLNQRDALRFGVEHYRRSEFCKGSLIWQLNDCWPVQSWAILDSAGNYKALAYELRRLYAPFLLSLVRDGDTMRVHGVLDGLGPSTSGTALVTAYRLTTGDALGTWEAPFELAEGERKPILEIPLRGLSVPDTLVYATTGDADAWALLAEPKEARLPPAAPLVISTHSDGALDIHSPTPLVDLMLTEAGSPAPFLDNFITRPEPGVFEVRVSHVPKEIEARSLAGMHPVRLTRSPL